MQETWKYFEQLESTAELPQDAHYSSHVFGQAGMSAPIADVAKAPNEPAKNNLNIYLCECDSITEVSTSTLAPLPISRLSS